jgi:hypothetical protein
MRLAIFPMAGSNPTTSFFVDEIERRVGAAQGDLHLPGLLDLVQVFCNEKEAASLRQQWRLRSETILFMVPALHGYRV